MLDGLHTGFWLNLTGVFLEYRNVYWLTIAFIGGIFYWSFLCIDIYFQVKLFLHSIFGIPYDTNFYDGDWLLGPNHFCWQPVCFIAEGLSDYAMFAQPASLDELRAVLTKIKLHKETINQFK